MFMLEMSHAFPSTGLVVDFRRILFVLFVTFLPLSLVVVTDDMSRRGRKRKAEDEEQKIVEGEQDNLSSDETRQEIETMWEVIEAFAIAGLLRRTFSHSRNAVLDTTDLSISSSDEGIPQRTTVLHIRDGEDAADTEGLEATGKHHDVFAEVSTFNSLSSHFFFYLFEEIVPSLSSITQFPDHQSKAAEGPADAVRVLDQHPRAQDGELVQGLPREAQRRSQSTSFVNPVSVVLIALRRAGRTASRTHMHVSAYSDQKREQRFLDSRDRRHRAGVLERLPRRRAARRQRLRESHLQAESLAAENRL